MKKRKVFHYLKNLDFYIATINLIVLVVLTTLGVIMRYVFNKPFTWLEEVQLFSMVWIVFSGAGLAFRTHSHVAIEMVVEQFPVSMQKVIDYLIHITFVILIGYLFYTSIGYLQMFIKNGRKTSMLDIPMWVFYGIVPIACIDMLISYFYSLKHDDGDEEEKLLKGEE